MVVDAAGVVDAVGAAAGAAAGVLGELSVLVVDGLVSAGLGADSDAGSELLAA